MRRKIGDQPPEQPDKDMLAKAIEKISDGMQKLTNSGLNKRAVMILLKHETGVSLNQIESVLDSLSELAGKYTK